MTLSISLRNNVIPTPTTAVPPFPINVDVSPGKTFHIPVTSVKDQKGNIMTSWSVDTDNHAIGIAVKDDTGIMVTGGIVEGTCTIKVS